MKITIDRFLIAFFLIILGALLCVLVAPKTAGAEVAWSSRSRHVPSSFTAVGPSTRERTIIRERPLPNGGREITIDRRLPRGSFTGFSSPGSVYVFPAPSRGLNGPAGGRSGRFFRE